MGKLMKMYVRIFVFILLALPLAAEQNTSISSLLDKYTYSADLSKKTKQESAGYLIIFTRQDLERMQASTLYEVLESVPMFRYNEDNKGLYNPLYQSHQLAKNNVFRLYVNEYEVVLPYFGNPVQTYGLVDIGYIDHIEIYLGQPSFEFGVEPSMLVIKMYTKQPTRENVNMINLSGDQRGFFDGRLMTADEGETISHIAYLNYRNAKRKKYHVASQGISRDTEAINFYGALSNASQRLALQYYRGHADNFLGSSWDATPQEANADVMHATLTWDASLMDDTLKLHASYYYHEAQQRERDDKPFIYDYIDTQHFYSSLEAELEESTLSFMAQKSLKLQSHAMLLGAQYRKKRFNVVKYELDGVNRPLRHRYDEEDIFSFFLEEQYSIQENQLLLASLKYSYFRPNGADMDDTNSLNYRFGYTYADDKFVFKGYYSHSNLRPEPIILLSGRTADDLGSEELGLLMAEGSYRNNDHLFRLAALQAEYDNYIRYNGTQYVNMEENYIVKGLIADYQYSFNYSERLDVDMFVMDTDNYGSESVYGGSLRLFNSYGPFELYNQLVVRAGYTSIGIEGSEKLDTGFDYNFALTYRYGKSLSLALKGENVFDQALKTVYFAYDPIAKNMTAVGPVSAKDRRITAILEYLF